MATYTTNLNLKKPAGTESANIADINNNMDLLDSAYADLNSFRYGGTVPNNTDLNNVTTPGFYLLSTSNTYVNAPDRTAYSLLVLKTSAASTTIYQFCFGNVQFIGRLKSSSWTPWHNMDRYGDGWQGHGTNIDEMVTPGVYGIDSNTDGGTKPSGVTGGVLVVYAPAHNTSYVAQVLYAASSICFRLRWGSSGTAWNSWYKIPGTQA